MNLAKHFYEIDTLGFTIIENVVSSEQSSLLKKLLIEARVEDQRRWGSRAQKKENLVSDLTTHGEDFIQFLDNDVMDTVFANFIGKSWTLYTYSSTFLDPQDRPSYSEIHVDSSRFIPGYYSALQMTLALDDFTESNGSTFVLPGSHKTEAAPDQRTFERFAIRTDRPAGAALFWNPRLYHRAGNNITEKTRFGLSTYGVRSFMKPRFDYPRMVPPALLERASPRVRRILGFDVRVPTDMGEFYVPAEERLYKANQG